mgnify:FL=1
MKVRMINADMHRMYPEYYPSVGTIGTVMGVEDDGMLLVKWPNGSLLGKNSCTCVCRSDVTEVSEKEYGITIDNIKLYAEKFGVKVDANLYRHTMFMTGMAREYARKRTEDYYKALIYDINGDVNKLIDLFDAMEAAWTTYEEYKEIAAEIRRELDKVM